MNQETIIELGEDRDRIKVEMSVKSYILIEKALRSHMHALGEVAQAAVALQDDTGRKNAVGHYHHAKNLLAKFLDGRALIA